MASRSPTGPPPTTRTVLQVASSQLKTLLDFKSKRLRLYVGVWIRQAEVRGLSFSVGGSCRKHPPASASCILLHSAPAGPRRSSSSNRLQMRGHFQWPPSPHSCDQFCTLLLACVPKAGWPAHNSIELLIGEGGIAVVRKPCRCFNHRASGCLLNGRISRLTQSLQGPHPLLLRCDLVSS